MIIIMVLYGGHHCIDAVTTLSFAIFSAPHFSETTKNEKKGQECNNILVTRGRKMVRNLTSKRPIGGKS